MTDLIRDDEHRFVCSFWATASGDDPWHLTRDCVDCRDVVSFLKNML